MRLIYYSSEVKQIARLAGPLVISQLSQVGMGVTDTVMAGRLSAVDLAAVAIGSSLWLPVYLACLGVMMAISPVIAQLRGANQFADIGSVFHQAIWLGFVLALFSTPGTAYIGIIMPWLNIDATIIPVSLDYLGAIAWGMPAVCTYLAFRFASEGLGYTRPIMYIQLVALFINAVGNYIFMYGRLGFPAMGAEGAGWSSAVVLWVNAVFILMFMRFNGFYRPFMLFTRFARPESAEILSLLRLGTPIAITITMEVGLFTAVSLLMGSLGVTAVAAHQIALNYTALTFMVPLGISLAITVRVGHAVGAKAIHSARFTGVVGMVMAVITMALSASIILIIPDKIVYVYTNDLDVAALAMSLLLVAALFQISDGLQVSAVGALRGFKDTKVPMLITLFAYWLVGFPLSWWLGIHNALGPQGLWAGLILGLTIAAILLSLRFHMVSQSPSGNRNFSEGKPV